jgi:hypothetical protein
MLTLVVWRERVDRGWIDFPDTGEVAPGAVVTRTLSWKRGQFGGRYSTDLGNCSVVETRTSGGIEWKSPEFVSESDYFFPSPRPNDATPVPATLDNPSHDPIGIVGCVVRIDPGRTRDLETRTATCHFSRDSATFRASPSIELSSERRI